VLFVNFKEIVYTRTKSLEVYADDNLFLVSVRLSVLGPLITEILVDFCKLLRIELVGTKSELEGEPRIYSAVGLDESLNLFE
jgi:hypothetical protein